jgi:uncharacterized membrane protein
MAAELTTYALSNTTALLEIPAQLLNKFSSLITLFQAIGGLIIIYIIFHIVNLIWNRRRAKEAAEMRELLEKINKKLDKVVKKK